MLITKNKSFLGIILNERNLTAVIICAILLKKNHRDEKFPGINVHIKMVVTKKLAKN